VDILEIFSKILTKISIKNRNFGKIELRGPMKDRLKFIKTPYIDAQTLLNLWADYRKPRERISRMVKNEELIRLKNGFYLITDKIQLESSGKVIPYEQIANLLYGPSYVSLEWALSFYGMIPERVHTVTSMTLGRNKEFHTPIGDFVYNTLSPKSYSIGVTQKQAVSFIGGFLIATPEKALADLVFKTCKGLNKNQMKQELLESKRIDPEVFHQLDKNLLEAIGHSYRSQSVRNLIDLVGSI
jgi:predicted transcriptional regulator of viral defense system